MAKFYRRQHRVTIAIMGKVAVRLDCWFNSVLGRKGSQIKQTNKRRYLFWLVCRNFQKASRFQNSFIKSLIAKTNEKSKTSKVSKTTRQPPLVYPLKGSSYQHWPRNQGLSCKQRGQWKRACSQRPHAKSSISTRMPPYLISNWGSHMDPSQRWWGSEGLFQ